MAGEKAGDIRSSKLKQKMAFMVILSWELLGQEIVDLIHDFDGRVGAIEDVKVKTVN